MQRACNLPRDQDTRGQKGEEGVGGMPRILLCKVYAGGVQGGCRQGDRRPKTRKPGKRGKGGRGRTSTQGAGLGKGAGAEKGSGKGGLLRKLLRTVLALAGGQRHGGGGERTEAC